MHEKMRVAISLGANLELPSETIMKAWNRLACKGMKNMRLSSLYETKPVDCVPDTPRFVNAAGTGWWAGNALELLSVCQRVEREFGRPSKHSSHEARSLDLDILLWGEQCISTAGLVIPHPRLSERLFVLVPLAELAPDWRVPGTGMDVADLRDSLLRMEDGENWGRRLSEPHTGEH